MTVIPQEIELRTKGDAHCIDITADVEKALGSTDLQNGIVHLFVVGSTAALTTIEFEPGCVHDLQEMFERIAPQSGRYKHHERWGDHNGHSHMRASLLGPHLAVPFIDGRLRLGTWQQIILVDFDDRPRTRRLVVQTIGE